MSAGGAAEHRSAQPGLAVAADDDDIGRGVGRVGEDGICMSTSSATMRLTRLDAMAGEVITDIGPGDFVALAWPVATITMSTALAGVRTAWRPPSRGRRCGRRPSTRGPGRARALILDVGHDDHRPPDRTRGLNVHVRGRQMVGLALADHGPDRSAARSARTGRSPRRASPRSPGARTTRRCAPSPARTARLRPAPFRALRRRGSIRSADMLSMMLGEITGSRRTRFR